MTSYFPNSKEKKFGSIDLTLDNYAKTNWNYFENIYKFYHFVIEMPDDDKLKLFSKYLQLIFDKVKMVSFYNFKISH